MATAFGLKIPHLCLACRTSTPALTLMVTLTRFILNLIGIGHLLSDGLQHIAN